MKKINKIIIFLIILILVSSISFLLWDTKILGSEIVGVVPYGNNTPPSWNEKSSEITVNETFKTTNNKDYNNLMMTIGFYKDTNSQDIIKNKTFYNIKTENGKIDIFFTEKLPEKPNSYSIEFRY
ncbi:hypothetical protein SDC9_03766 [bioreactor metagenome]|uniref:Uncharacterized protein n=1 Tax=bioreactor metagenome TaxID=1076179 RepID=A0A644SUC5_9ZZZZ|nr:hypothetical protein [Methanobrevibacter sp.]MEA4956374.1 hypothetical protein [Methanobrevibacter sp.]